MDNSRQPITSTQTIRFSFWSNSDFIATDITGTGDINTSAANYGNWTEEQNFTPNQYGIFSVEIGNITPLPNIDYSLHKYLQVEIKPSGAANTSYEILDPTGDMTDTTDRKTLNSAVYALNADKVDNTDVGTNIGDLVKLGSNRQWGINFIPGGTNENQFIMDNDDSSATNIFLQFGKTLQKILKFDILQSWFVFNADLQIEGKLSLTGDTINLNNPASSDLDVYIIANQNTSSGGTIKYDVSNQTWQLSNFGNVFADIVTTSFSQTLTNKTID